MCSSALILIGNPLVTVVAGPCTTGLSPYLRFSLEVENSGDPWPLCGLTALYHTNKASSTAVVPVSGVDTVSFVKRVGQPST